MSEILCLSAERGKFFLLTSPFIEPAVQKVAKFGEKLDEEGIIRRLKDDLKEKYIYLGKE